LITLNNTADTVADIQWRIYSSRYIYSGRYTAADTVPDIQYWIKIHIHRGKHTGADTQPCGRKIRFSPPPLTLAGEAGGGKAHGDTGIMEVDRATGSIYI